MSKLPVLETIQRYQFGKDQKLKSRKLIVKLFAEGRSCYHKHIKAVWLCENPFLHLQAGVSVSTRSFRNATDRNRIKRLMREAWRLQKNELESLLIDKKMQLSVFLIYTGSVKPDYDMVFDDCKQILKKIKKDLHAVT